MPVICESCTKTAPGKYCNECGKKRELTVAEEVTKILREHKLIPDEAPSTPAPKKKQPENLLEQLEGGNE